jgi:putative ABC transport system substrate-binding protein
MIIINGRLPALAEDATVLIAGPEPAALAAKSATSAIPIVFVVGSDPNKLGIVESFKRHGRAHLHHGLKPSDSRCCTI